MDTARAEILNRVRQSVSNIAQTPISPLPSTARVRSRQPGTLEAELALLLTTIQDLGGKTRRITSLPDFDAALSELVRDENIKRATLWETLDLREFGVAERLLRLGVELVPALEEKRVIAACDVGITGADAALAESGTLVLASSPAKPPMVSLLPRIHLAIFRPSTLRADLRELLADLSNQKHFVFISGPSRTTDIEKVLTLGVHGPKELYAWCYE
jgi:L-lactate dehydrogenase complex protein LldG